MPWGTGKIRGHHVGRGCALTVRLRPALSLGVEGVAGVSSKEGYSQHIAANGAILSGECLHRSSKFASLHLVFTMSQVAHRCCRTILRAHRPFSRREHDLEGVAQTRHGVVNSAPVDDCISLQWGGAAPTRKQHAQSPVRCSSASDVSHHGLWTMRTAQSLRPSVFVGRRPPVRMRRSAFTPLGSVGRSLSPLGAGEGEVLQEVRVTNEASCLAER